MKYLSFILQGDRHFVKLSRIFRCVQMQRRIIHEPKEEMRSLVNTSELRKKHMGLRSNNSNELIYFSMSVLMFLFVLLFVTEISCYFFNILVYHQVGE